MFVLKLVVTFLALILFLIGTFYVFIAYPIVAMVRCTGDKTIDVKEKALWLTSILVLGPFAAGAYSIVNPGSPSHRGKGSATLLFAVLWFVALGGGYEYARSDAAGRSRASVETLRFENVDPAAQKAFRENGRRLADEIEHGPWYRFDEQVKLVGLATQLKTLTEDGSIDKLEYDEWITAFDSRKEKAK